METGQEESGGDDHLRLTYGSWMLVSRNTRRRVGSIKSHNPTPISHRQQMVQNKSKGVNSFPQAHHFPFSKSPAPRLP